MADKFFLVIFGTVVALTALCGILMGAVAIFGPVPQPAPIAAAFDTLRMLFTACCLSIFALLGSRIRIPRDRL